MQKCGCAPGTESNGWHETRSVKCLQKERVAFQKALEVAANIIRKKITRG